MQPNRSLAIAATSYAAITSSSSPFESGTRVDALHGNVFAISFSLLLDATASASHLEYFIAALLFAQLGSLLRVAAESSRLGLLRPWLLLSVINLHYPIVKTSSVVVVNGSLCC